MQIKVIIIYYRNKMRAIIFLLLNHILNNILWNFLIFFVLLINFTQRVIRSLWVLIAIHPSAILIFFWIKRKHLFFVIRGAFRSYMQITNHGPIVPNYSRRKQIRIDKFIIHHSSYSCFNSSKKQALVENVHVITDSNNIFPINSLENLEFGFSVFFTCHLPPTTNYKSRS